MQIQRMLFIVALWAFGLIPCAIVWRLTRRSTPPRAATIRALCATLCFVPGLAPFVHGAVPVPFGLMLPGMVGSDWSVSFKAWSLVLPTMPRRRRAHRHIRCACAARRSQTRSSAGSR